MITGRKAGRRFQRTLKWGKFLPKGSRKGHDEATLIIVVFPVISGQLTKIIINPPIFALFFSEVIFLKNESTALF